VNHQLVAPATDAPSVRLVPSDDFSTTSPRVVLGTANGWPMRLAYLSCDFTAVLISVLIGKLFWSLAGGTALIAFGTLELKLYGLLSVGAFLASFRQGAYSALPPRPIRQFRGWTIAVFLTGGGIVAIHAMLVGFSQQVFFAMAGATVCLHLSATFIRAICRIRFGKSNWWGTQVIVVGCNDRAQLAMRTFFREPQWGVRPIGFVSEEAGDPEMEQHPWNIGSIENLDSVAAKKSVTRAVVALHDLDFDLIQDTFIKASSSIRSWFILPTSGRTPALWMNVNQVARLPALTFQNYLATPSNIFVKRTLDLFVAISCALILAPLIAGIAVLIKLTSKGPVFYAQKRIGKNGIPFRVWKFRTMSENADELLKTYLADNPHLKVEWEESSKLKKDPRITTVGRFLRTTSLDELPQLANVLIGNMSLVGPRPLPVDDIDKYGEGMSHYENVSPGITGLWQVSGRNNTSYPERISLDGYYVENWSIWLDLYILAATVRVVLLREGAY